METARILKDELFHEILRKYSCGEITRSQAYSYGVEYRNYSVECYNLKYFEKLLQHKVFTSFQDIYEVVTADPTFFSQFLTNVSFLDLLEKHHVFDSSCIDEIFQHCLFDDRLTDYKSIDYNKLANYKIHETNFVNFCKNPKLLSSFLKLHKDDCSIHDIIKILSEEKMLEDFVHDERALVSLYKENLLNDNDLLSLYNNCSSLSELSSLLHVSSSYYNTSTESMFVLLTLLEKDLLSFDDVYKKFEANNSLNVFLSSSKFFENAIKLGKVETSTLLDIFQNANSTMLYSLGHNSAFIRQLLVDKAISFKELLETHKRSERIAYTEILTNSTFFRMARDEGFLSRDDLKFLADALKKEDDLMKLVRNEELSYCLLQSNVLDLESLIVSSVSKSRESLSLHEIASSANIFQFCIDHHLLDKESVTRIYESLVSNLHLDSLIQNHSLLKYVFDNNIVDFSTFVDLCKEDKKPKNVYGLHPLWKFLVNKDLFKHLLETGQCRQKELDYLLTIVDNSYELAAICSNQHIIRSLLDNNVFNRKVYNYFISTFSDRRDVFVNRQFTPTMLEYVLHIIRDTTHDFEWLKTLHESAKDSKRVLREVSYDKRNFATYVEYANKYLEENISKELIKDLKAAELFGEFNLTKEQEEELLAILDTSRNALLHLEQIVENNLEGQYDFEKLRELLAKDDRKKKIKMNF